MQNISELYSSYNNHTITVKDKKDNKKQRSTMEKIIIKRSSGIKNHTNLRNFFYEVPSSRLHSSMDAQLLPRSPTTNNTQIKDLKKKRSCYCYCYHRNRIHSSTYLTITTTIIIIFFHYLGSPSYDNQRQTSGNTLFSRALYTKSNK